MLMLADFVYLSLAIAVTFYFNQGLMIESMLLSHLELAEQAYALLLEENQSLKIQGNAMGESFATRKQAIMVQLDSASSQLKALREKGPVEGIKAQEVIQKAQKKIMQVFLLSKENEELMLKNDFNSKQPVQSVAASKLNIKQVYSTPSPITHANK